MSCLIDADPLIEQMDAEPEGGYYSPHDVISLLMTQPVVEERKTGKWIHTDTQAGYDINGDLVWADMMECETCGFKICTIKEQYNYCPNCGARMER